MRSFTKSEFVFGLVSAIAAVIAVYEFVGHQQEKHDNIVEQRTVSKEALAAVQTKADKSVEWLTSQSKDLNDTKQKLAVVENKVDFVVKQGEDNSHKLDSLISGVHNLTLLSTPSFEFMIPNTTTKKEQAPAARSPTVKPKTT